MRNSAAPGRTGPTQAMMTVMRRYFRFITNLNCPEDARLPLYGCTYEDMDTYCEFGDETVVECDTDGEIHHFPATGIVASYGDRSNYETSPHGTVLVYFSVTDESTGDAIRQTIGYFCAADVKNQASADKICKLLKFQDTSHAVEWKSGREPWTSI